MRIRYSLMTLAAAAATSFAPMPAVAGATKFGFRPIIVQGTTQVDARAINNSDVVVGSFTTTGPAQGFILHGTTLTALPSPCDGCAVVPTAVNASGVVAGWIPEASEVFQFDGTAYIPGAMQVYGPPGTSTPGPGLNNHGYEYFDGNRGSGSFEIYAGTPPNVVPVTQLNGAGDFFANSVNNRNTIAGTFFGGPHGGTLLVFKALAGAYVEVSPPGATGAWGGYVNDANQVAGAYEDAKGLLHGFVEHRGAYTIFNMPVRTKTLNVLAINDKGRVLGTFIDEQQVAQRAFLFNGQTVTVFGKYPVADTLHLALNDEGVMLVSDTTPSGVPSSSRVLCGGPGC